MFLIHLKKHHLSKLLLLRMSVLSMVATIVYYSFVYDHINTSLVFVLIFACVLIMGINLKGSRNFEDEADLFVNEKGYGKELISALKKLSYDELDVNKFDQLFSDHPDIRSRINNLSDDDKE